MQNEEAAHQVYMCVCNNVKQGLQTVIQYHMNKQIFGRNNKNVKIHYGEQDLKQLKKQNKTLATVDISGDKSLRTFKKTANSYGVDFAVKKIPKSNQYVIYFKANDSDVMTRAFNEYKKIAGTKKSLIKRLNQKEKEVKQQTNEKLAEKTSEEIKNVKSKPTPEIEKSL